MFSLHTHDGKSSASRGFADSSIKLRDLVVRAKEIGLKGVAITNHESVGSFIEAKNLEKELDFPVICGNEIYLVSDKQYECLKNDYQKGMYFPHFLLLALDEVGNRQLRELSTIAWENNSFTQSGLIRTPTKMSDIESVIGEDSGHIIASSACIGGQIGRWVLDIVNENATEADKQHKEKCLHYFINWCLKTFGEDNFYLECQPASDAQVEQIIVNDYILKLSKRLNIPYIITTDAHYLQRELLPLHSAFLNSSEDSDREVEAFYRTAYLMNEEEVIDYFKPYWSLSDIKQGLMNTDIIGNRAKRYEMKGKQIIPKIELDKGWSIEKNFYPKLEYIQKMIQSEYEQDRYLMYKIMQGMRKLIPFNEYKDTFARIEQEVTEFWHVSEIIGDRLGSYFITVSKLVEIMWEDGDSLVGVGRGSGVSSIINYLLEVTQLNPLKMPVDMPFYRFVDRARAELADIDIDTQSDKRRQVFLAIKRYFEKLGGEVVNCCTYGTVGSKSAIITACRGIGISSDEAQNISGLIPVERGFNWTLDECYYGDEKKDRKPIPEFKKIIDSYESLWDTAKLIEGCIISRGTHASGVFITNDKFTNYNAKMRSPDGTLTSQYDLHESEQFFLIKYDLLTISGLTKIRYTLESLIRNGHINKQKTLKDTYKSILDPHKIVYDTPKTWSLIANNEVTDLFQFDTQVAMQTVSNIKPHSLIELAQSNSLMRLQKQEGHDESPTQMYVRYKNDVNEWYKDMDRCNVPKKDQKFLYEHLKAYNFVCDTQESMMGLVKLKDLTNFSVAESHDIRKIIAKKQMGKIPIMKQSFIDKGVKNGVDINTLTYLWDNQFMLQAGYAFSILHTMAYTFIALQELILYTNYPSIFWNCACLTVNSGAIEENAFSEQQKDKSTNYGKVATAIGKMREREVNIALPNVNLAEMIFKPDEVNNQIIYGLKGIMKINNEDSKLIMSSRPFNSMKDFYDRMVLTKKEVISGTGKTQKKSLIDESKFLYLVKAGGFDEIENKNRAEILEGFLKSKYPPKTKLTASNIDSVVKMGIIPNKFKTEVRLHNFLKYIKGNKFIQDSEVKSIKWYTLNNGSSKINDYSTDFFNEHFASELSENKDYKYDENGDVLVALGTKRKGSFLNVYSCKVGELTTWLDSPECLDLYNKLTFDRIKEENMSGNISSWEMESMNFYYHEHELAHIDKKRYNISSFNDLPEDGVVVGYSNYKGKKYPKYQLSRITGTVLDRNKTKHSVTLLTPEGVVLVKFYAGQFGFYDKTISQDTGEVNAKGKPKKIKLEDGWFKRGSKLIITGYRRGDQFKPKVYTDTIYNHTVEKILSIDEDGIVRTQTDRIKKI